jgi:hypothetical protein
VFLTILNFFKYNFFLAYYIFLSLACLEPTNHFIAAIR